MKTTKAYWYYEVTWYMDEEKFNNAGFVCAANYGEAAMKLVAAYTDVESMTIAEVPTATTVLDFNDILDLLGANSHFTTLGSQMKEVLKDAQQAFGEL